MNVSCHVAVRVTSPPFSSGLGTGNGGVNNNNNNNFFFFEEGRNALCTVEGAPCPPGDTQPYPLKQKTSGESSSA